MGQTLYYRLAYTVLKYPMGDVPILKGVYTDIIRPLAKVNLRASNSAFLQLNSFLNQIVYVYSYSVLLISENA